MQYKQCTGNQHEQHRDVACVMLIFKQTIKIFIAKNLKSRMHETVVSTSQESNHNNCISYV